jgi:hypothetical protein
MPYKIQPTTGVCAPRSKSCNRGVSKHKQQEVPQVSAQGAPSKLLVPLLNSQALRTGFTASAALLLLLLQNCSGFQQLGRSGPWIGRLRVAGALWLPSRPAAH